jgi:hypothetical protein
VILILATGAMVIRQTLETRKIQKQIRLDELKLAAESAKQQTLSWQGTMLMGVGASEHLMGQSIQGQIRERQTEAHIRQLAASQALTTIQQDTQQARSQLNTPEDAIAMQRRMNQFDATVMQAIAPRAQIHESRTATEASIAIQQRIEEAGGIESVVDRYLASPTVAQIVQERNERLLRDSLGLGIPETTEPVKPKKDVRIKRERRRVRV